jgi:hypothetical protein
LAFDGVDDFVCIPDSAELRPTSLTLSAWVRTTDSTRKQPIVAKAQAPGNWVSYMLRVQDGGRLSFVVGNSARGHEAHWRTKTRLKGATWQHVAATWACHAGDASDAKIYIDGVEQAHEMTLDTGYSASFCIGYTSEPLYVGRDEFPSGYFCGSLAQVEVLDRVLTLAELTAQVRKGRKE